MFSRSVLFLVLGALVILQVSVRGEKETQNIPNTEWENVQKSIEKTIDDLSESTTKITASIKRVVKIEESVIEQMRNTIKSDIQRVVDGLQNQAEEANVDIKSCLEDVSDGGDSLANTLLKKAIQCITDEIVTDNISCKECEMNIIIRPLVGNVRMVNFLPTRATQCVCDENNKAKKILCSEEELVKEVNTTWKDAKKERDNCESSPNVTNCRGKLVADAGVKEGDYASQEGQLVNEAATLIKKLQKDTDYCVIYEMSSIPEKLTRMILTIVQCVKNMTETINNNNN